MQKEYKTIREISGPLVFVEKTDPVSFGELVQISLPDGWMTMPQVVALKSTMTIHLKLYHRNTSHR